MMAASSKIETMMKYLQTKHAGKERVETCKEYMYVICREITAVLKIALDNVEPVCYVTRVTSFRALWSSDVVSTVISSTI